VRRLLRTGGSNRARLLCRFGVVSYDLAVWEGPLPGSDADAAARFETLMDQLDGVTNPISEGIRALVFKLTRRWPDGDDSSPWSTGPLASEANGSFIYIPMTFSGAALGVLAVANEAARLGLVCFDPQDEMMLN